MIPRASNRLPASAHTAHSTARTRDQLLKLCRKHRVGLKSIIKRCVCPFEVHLPTGTQDGIIKLSLERHAVRIPAWGWCAASERHCAALRTKVDASEPGSCPACDITDTTTEGSEAVLAETSSIIES